MQTCTQLLGVGTFLILHFVRKRNVNLSYAPCGHYGQQEREESMEKHQSLYINLASGHGK